MAGHSTKAKGVDRRKNPYRNFFRENVTDEQLRAIWLKVLQAAEEGDIKAQKEVLDRLFGRPDVKVQADVQQLEKIVPPWMLDNADKP